MQIKVQYMSGAGNLFSVIDNRKSNFDVNTLKTLAPVLCGKNEYNDFISEGLIAIENSSDYNFAVKFFNPDGSYGAMCGNGGRCAVAFADYLHLISNKDIIQFEMAAHIYEASINDDTISLTFPFPTRIELNLNIELDGRIIPAAFVDNGADHAIINYDETGIRKTFREFDINRYGKEIRHNVAFQPNGVNANFYTIENGLIQLRTYERGVEAETGACGTGAIATAIACNMRHGLPYPLTIIPPSRQALTVDALFDNEKIKHVILSGPAETLDTKTIEIPDSFFEAQND
jgi:diaminopimelate epimerase